MPSRVIGSTRPAASPATAQRWSASASAPNARASSEGIGHEYLFEPRTLRESRAPHPRVRPIAQRGRRQAAVGLRADADRQMIRARKRPEIAGRIGDQLDDDFIARGSVREKSCCDRQLLAGKRARDPAAHQAVRAVGADDHGSAMGPAGRLDADAVGADADIDDAHALEHCAGALRGVEQRRIERGAAGHDQRRVHGSRVIERDDRRVSTMRVDEARGTDRAPGKHVLPQGIGDERQRAAGDAAAARFFSRMRRVEDRHARAAPRERVGRPRARWPRADDRDVAPVH